MQLEREMETLGRDSSMGPESQSATVLSQERVVGSAPGLHFSLKRQHLRSRTLVLVFVMFMTVRLQTKGSRYKCDTQGWGKQQQM